MVLGKAVQQTWRNVSELRNCAGQDGLRWRMREGPSVRGQSAEHSAQRRSCRPDCQKSKEAAAACAQEAAGRLRTQQARCRSPQAVVKSPAAGHAPTVQKPQKRRASGRRRETAYRRARNSNVLVAQHAASGVGPQCGAWGRRFRPKPGKQVSVAACVLRGSIKLAGARRQPQTAKRYRRSAAGRS